MTLGAQEQLIKDANALRSLENNGKLTPAQVTNIVASGVANTGAIIAQSYTWAGKPAAASFTGPAFITNVAGGSYWVSNGVRWKPLNNELNFYTPSTIPISDGTNVEAIVIEVPLLASIWQNGDIMVFEIMATKSAGVDSNTSLWRLGTVSGTKGTTTNALLHQPSTTTRRYSVSQALKRLSATSIVVVDIDDSTTGLGIDTGAYSPQTVPNMDTQTTYLQLTCQMDTGGIETVSFPKFIATLKTPTN